MGKNIVKLDSVTNYCVAEAKYEINLLQFWLWVINDTYLHNHNKTHPQPLGRQIIAKCYSAER